MHTSSMEVEETIDPVKQPVGLSPDKRQRAEKVPADDVEDNYEDDDEEEEDENAPEETDRETIEPPLSNATQERPLFSLQPIKAT